MRYSQKNRMMLACSQKIEGIPEVIRLLPLGLVKSQKGDFKVDEESFRKMRDWVLKRGIDIVIDYEHQTLKDVQAPAGGWIKELILTDDAICGRVEWTDKAAEYLKNREYRYLSPVVLVRESDKKALLMNSVALTNTPAIDGMFPIINSLDFDFDEGDDDMDLQELLKQLAALLGLAEGATDQDVIGAITKLADEVKVLKETDKNNCEVVANKAILSLLSLKDDAKTPEVAAKIVQLQNPANFVPVEQYNLIANKLKERENGGMVELALKEGKITPAQKAWAEQYAAQDAAGFKAFVDLAVPVVPMQQLTLSAKPQNRTPVDPEIARQLGISTEDVAKYGKEDA